MSKCKFNDCDKRAIFNIPTEKRGNYCKEHKSEQMIDVMNPKCFYEGCGKIPGYNFVGEKKGLYCNTHKLENMINVKDKTCKYDSCNKIPLYNLSNEKYIEPKETRLIHIELNTSCLTLFS